MYGLVQAGDNGWGSSSAIVPSLAGLGALAVFAVWEAWLTARPGGEPLIDLGLFRSRSFSWGIVLAAAGVFGMFGVLFTLPQYLQAIMGLDAQGAGLRFLPAIAGMVVGAVPADRVAARLGPKITITVGFGILSAGMFLGSGTCGFQRRRLHRRLDLRGRDRSRARARHGGLCRGRRAIGGAERCRGGLAPGGHQARPRVRGHDPGQCPQLHVPGPGRRRGTARGGCHRGAAERVRRASRWPASSGLRRCSARSRPRSWPAWTMPRERPPSSQPWPRSWPWPVMPRHFAARSESADPSNATRPSQGAASAVEPTRA